MKLPTLGYLTVFKMYSSKTPLSHGIEGCKYMAAELRFTSFIKAGLGEKSGMLHGTIAGQSAKVGSLREDLLNKYSEKRLSQRSLKR